MADRAAGHRFHQLSRTQAVAAGSLRGARRFLDGGDLSRDMTRRVPTVHLLGDTEAKESMFRSTDTDFAPWTVIKSNDKKRARIETLRFVLSALDYPDKDDSVVGQPDPLLVGPASEVYETEERASS